MARFGINPNGTLGIPIPELRKIASRAGKNHELALQLWDSGIHEARILAGYIEHPMCVTERQFEKWASQFDSWDVCDQVCGSLFDKTEFAISKAREYSSREEEFVKRTGFVLMACLAVHDRRLSDKTFVEFLGLVKRESADGRNFVKKAVNWALRQIGKRNKFLNSKAKGIAREIELIDSPAAKWIAKDALRELESDKVRLRLGMKPSG